MAEVQKKVIKKLTQQEKEDKKAKKLAEAKAAFIKEAEAKFEKFKTDLEAEEKLTPDQIALKKAKDRMAELRAKVTKIESKEEIKKNRSSDTRQKILMGAYIKEHPKKWEEIVSRPEFDAFLTRPIDRKLFGFSEEPVSTQQPISPSEGQT